MKNDHTGTLPFNNPLVKFISEKRYRLLRHALFIFVGLLLAFKGDIGDSPFSSEKVKDTILLVDCISFVFIMGMIYFMLLVLIPRLLFRSKLFLFILSFILTVTIIYFEVWVLDHYMLKPLDPGHGWQHVELSLMQFIQVGAVASVLLASVVGISVFKKWIIDVQRMNELQQTNLKAELEQLKSQVNPHFLFNTLNNLLVLMKTDPDKATQVLLGLSDLLRYQLYDSSREKILLSKDISFIENLLALEKIRKNDFDYEITSEGDIDQVSLPPFLFIPFVENAIKHGASTVGHSYLKVHFRITQNRLFFSSENSKPAIQKIAPGGLGLKNINRRLELIYPETHSLIITDDRDKYIVNLIIPL